MDICSFFTQKIIWEVSKKPAKSYIGFKFHEYPLPNLYLIQKIHYGFPSISYTTLRLFYYKNVSFLAHLLPFNLLLRNDWANCIINQTWQKCSLFIPHSLGLIQNYDFLVGIHPELYPWSYGSWIYNDLCNQCLSPLMLLFWIPLMGKCTRYNIMWCLSVTYGRSVVFSRYFAFLHQ